MIFYGSKATQIGTEALFDKCSNCGTPNSIEMVVYQRYAHIYWIPFFPIGKTGGTYCSHCKQVLPNKEFSETLKTSFSNLKSASKTPIWTFTGLALAAVLIVWGVSMSKQKDQENAALIVDPRKGDIYEVRLGNKQYTLFKVDKVVGDTVFLFMNEYETNKSSGLADLKRKGDKVFIQEPLPMLKSELKNRLDEGEIIGIDRY